MYTNRQIWNVSYPIFLSLLAQNVINVTDTAFLGRVGEIELGASAMGGCIIYVPLRSLLGLVPDRRSSWLAVMGSGIIRKLGR